MESALPRVAPLQVLVIDDDQNDAMLLELACSMGQVKAKLHFVTDGQQAIAYLEGKPPYNNRLAHPWPGLILLDLKMPKVSGFHVLEWLRDHPQSRRTPVAVFTGTDAPGQMALCYALGADAFIIKPCDFCRLISMMHSLCNYCLKMRHQFRKTEAGGMPANLFTLGSDSSGDSISGSEGLGRSLE